MSFTTENRTLKDIFSRVAQYTVPRYQRDYVWTTTNWRELFVDISFTLSNKNEIEWSHFLGTIVLNNAKKPNLAPGIDEYEIIDGQQRLTTIFLMTSCVYRRLKELENDEANARAEYIYSQFLTSLSANNSRILRICRMLFNLAKMGLSQRRKMSLLTAWLTFRSASLPCS